MNRPIVANKLEKGVTEGRINTQEKQKLLGIYRRYACKKDARFIFLTQKGKLIKTVCIYKNCSPGRLIVKGNLLDEGTYEKSYEELKELSLKKIREEIPGVMGLRGKLNGYKISIINLSNYNRLH